LAFLKTKLAGFAGGVEEGFLSEYAEHFSTSIKEETAIPTTLTDGVIDQIKVAYGFYNKEVSKKTKQAQDTALKNFREKHGLDENGQPVNKGSDNKDKDKDKTKPDPDEPAWFKNYRENQQKIVDGLVQKLEKQEKEKTSASLTDKVKAHDKVKNIPASFLKGRNLVPESEEKIEQLATEIETDWNTFRQDLAEKDVHINIPPSPGSKAKEGETIGKQIAETKNAKQSEGVKGKTI
jgi:hypothetical protein